MKPKPQRIKDRTGQRMGRLVFQKFTGLVKNKQAYWQCLCDCGAIVVVSGVWVQSGNTRSCGCLRKERSAAALRTHGQSAGGRTPEYQLWLSAKSRSIRDGLPFDLSVFDIKIPEYCSLLGVKLTAGTRKAHDASPSLDKIIPELGYVKGNIQVISHRANWIKSNATLDELKTIIANWGR